ncbi:MFS transporter [Nonomuraea sp. NN258]|uniref:MFS transporter n=1 Tax=Nonomuraea antri TaxID=2730852 RepID=UPI0015686AC2|nr:MFS transporter [Nonomuraea antri]NRQ31631.1 MFS transporter [Nonomuraea antri]
MSITAPNTHNRNFLAYWTAVGTSQLGSAVTIVVVPLVAVVTLHAGLGQMAWLAAMGTLPVLLIRIPAAMWADSLANRLPYMIACNLLQAVIVGLVPLLWWWGALNFVLLLVLQGLAALLLGVYASLATPVVVQIVPKERLVDANGKLNTTRSVADITGPAISSGLLAVLAAPLVLLVDCVSFLLSALLLRRIRIEAPERQPGGRGGGATGELWQIAKFLAPRSGIQALIIVTLVNGLVDTILMLYLVHELRIGSALIGALIALGAVGGVSGGLVVGRLLDKFGPARTLTISAVLTILSLALLPFAGPGVTGAAAVVLFEFAGSFGGTILISTVFGTLQGAAKGEQVARVMAMAGTSMQVSALAGVGLGGLLGTWLDLRQLMSVAAGLLVAGLVVQIVRFAAARAEAAP